MKSLFQFYCFGLLSILCACSMNTNTTIVVQKNGDAKFQLDYYSVDQNYMELKKRPELDLWCAWAEITIYQMNSLLLVSDYSSLVQDPAYSSQWPVANLSAGLAREYCRRLNNISKGKRPQGYVFRLPTVKEWEAIARCGDARQYPWGNAWPPPVMKDGKLPNIMGEDFLDKPAAFMSKEKVQNIKEQGLYLNGYRDDAPFLCSVWDAGRNEWGIYGMAGNVKEWCYDEATGKYVLKGGCFYSTEPCELMIRHTNSDPVKNGFYTTFIGQHPSTYGTGCRIVLAKPIRQ